MEYKGNLSKMDAWLENPVRYTLTIGEHEIDMNELLGHKLSFRFDGQINCVICGKRTKTSFAQGFCYFCFQNAPQADESVVNPQLSKAEFGIARDLDWAVENDLIDHFVYLAVSKEVKVGVTRDHQIPIRWIDQGASYVIRLARTPNRHIAGIIEVFLKDYYTDKTSWKEMLQNQVNENIDLLSEKEKALALLPAELQQYACENNEIVHINYPVLEYPQNVISQNFDKDKIIGGKLTGIKGQYLIFDAQRAVNIRRHNGYFVIVER